MPEHDAPDTRRRSLLAAAALAAPAAAIGATAAREAEAQAQEAPGDTRLRDTEHTRAFYASARF